MISLAGLVVGLYWVVAGVVGECDRSACGQPKDFFFDTSLLGAALLVGSVAGLVVAVRRGLS